MKRKKIHVMILFISMTVFSQNNEIGVFSGGSNYIGDIGPTTYIHPFSYNISTNIVAGVIFRKNLNERIALRAIKSIAKYMNRDLATSARYLINAAEDVQRDIEKGKVK